MLDAERLLEFANQLFAAQTGDALNNVQRRVLSEALITRFKSKTYDQIAAETGYSGAYIRNIIARSLWQSFSEILEEKVTRRNIRTLLLEQSKADDTGLLPEAEVSLESEAAAEGIVETDADDNTSPQQLSSSAPWILVVDDQPHNLELLTHILEEEGYQVWSATNGADALKLVVMARPNLILLDVNMPGMSGYEVCQQLKADPQTQFIPVIFISALDESWDKVQAFSVGGVDYITKPFNTLETLIRIDHQIQIGATQAQLSGLGDQTSKTDPSQPPSLPTVTLQDASMDEQSAAKASIMLVDDDPKNLSLLADLLKEEKYDIWQATTGAEVLKFAPTLLPDLILLDINLPDMSGYNVCQQLRENEQTKLIPVIFVSALDATWDKLKGFAAGGNDYVTKPLQILELVCRIRNQLRLRQLRAQLSGWNAQSTD
ncbi:MAG: response regulator [Cyanobacteria bacterium P01_A01_bin.123]